MRLRWYVGESAGFSFLETHTVVAARFTTSVATVATVAAEPPVLPLVDPTCD